MRRKRQFVSAQSTSDAIKEDYVSPYAYDAEYVQAWHVIIGLEVAMIGRAKPLYTHKLDEQAIAFNARTSKVLSSVPGYTTKRMEDIA